MTNVLKERNLDAKTLRYRGRMPCDEERMRLQGEELYQKPGERGQILPKSLHKAPTLPVPSPWTSSLQNYQRINVCSLSYQLGGALLWQT